MHRRQLLAIGWLVGPALAFPQESAWEFSGNVALQSRSFIQEQRWPGQDGSDTQLSLSSELEWRWQNADGSQRASIIPFLRLDDTDEERTHVDLREAYWAWRGDEVEVLVGINKVFWGVTESVHLIDIINQTDAVEDIDGEDKLGQPMINVAWQRDWGLLNLFVMPYFRERTFPGLDGRFNTPLVVDTDDPRFESGANEKHTDLAARYSHYVGDVDVGVYWFSGTSREPRLLPNDLGTALVPVYDQIDQLGLDLQYTNDAWLWKLEAMVRDGVDDTFAAAVAGLEYTIFQITEGGADLGLLVEYQHDDRAASEPLSIADNDVFLGTRLALNDAQDTSLLAGVVVDTETSETFVNIEAERRFGNNYVIELRARALTGAQPDEPTYTFSRDDYFQLQIARYF